MTPQPENRSERGKGGEPHRLASLAARRRSWNALAKGSLWVDDGLAFPMGSQRF
jgi:hypothetical protein